MASEFYRVGVNWAVGGVGALVAGFCSPLLAAATLAVPTGGGRFRLPPRALTGGGAGAVRLVGIAAAAVIATLAVGARLGLTWALPAFWLLAAVGVPLAVIDASHHRLPYALVTPTYLSGLVFFAVDAVVSAEPARLIRAVVAGAVVGGGFLLFALIFAGKFGLGDVVLTGTIGLHLGWLGWSHILLGLLAGLGLGAIASTASPLLRRTARAGAFPLGPTLIAGYLIIAVF